MLKAVLLILGLIVSVPALAGKSMNLQGTVFSVTEAEFVLLSNNELFHIKKDGLPRDQRMKLETASTREITIDVPTESIVNVRRSGKKLKPEGF